MIPNESQDILVLVNAAVVSSFMKISSWMNFNRRVEKINFLNIFK